MREFTPVVGFKHRRESVKALLTWPTQNRFEHRPQLLPATAWLYPRCVKAMCCGVMSLLLLLKNLKVAAPLSCRRPRVSLEIRWGGNF